MRFGSSGKSTEILRLRKISALLRFCFAQNDMLTITNLPNLLIAPNPGSGAFQRFFQQLPLVKIVVLSFRRKQFLMCTALDDAAAIENYY